MMVPGAGDSASRSHPLLEREAELAALEPLLESATRGRGGVIFLEGAPGLGKSALLERTVDLAGQQGLIPLLARAREAEKALPHGVSQQLLLPAYEALPAGEAADVLSGAAVLARPLFDLTSSTEDAPEPDQGFARVHGLYWVCANLAERSPLFLALDDAHWADPASLRFLVYLARRIEQLPAALVMTVRSGEASALGGALAELYALPQTTVLRLAPLSEKSCRAIVESSPVGSVDDELCRKYYSITEGNPFLLHQVLGRLMEGGPDAADGLLEGGSPSEPLALSVARSRVTKAGEQELSLARAVAILGRDADLAMCSELSGLSRSDAKEALTSLRQEGVLRPSGSLEFTHPLVRSAVLDGIAPDELDVLYRNAAALLHERGGSPEQIATYLLLCEPVGETWAVDALRKAAERAAHMGAPDAVALYLERLLAEDLPRDERADAMVRYARSLTLESSGRAVEVLESALELVSEPERRVEVTGTIARVYVGQGHYEAAARTARRAMDEVPTEDRSLALKTTVEWASMARFVPAQRAEALQTMQTIIEADEPVEEEVAVHLYTGAALSQIRSGRDHKVASEALAQALPDPAAPPAYGFTNSILPVQLHCLAWIDEYHKAETLMNAALDEARRQGSLSLFATAGCYGALGIFQQGRVAEAASLAQQAIDAIPEGWGLALPLACTIAAYAHMERGELNEAQGVIDLALADERWEDSPQFPFLMEARGRLSMMWGNHEAAIADLRSAAGLLADLIGTSNPAVLAWRSRLARVLSVSGHSSAALDLALEEVVLAEEFGAPRSLAASLRVLGHLKGADGIADIERALGLVSGTTARLEEVNCLVALCRALRMAGDVRKARLVGNQGLVRAVRSGSLLMENAARAELAAAGARPRRRAVTGLASLTPGEMRVARLAALGRSNREVAEELFVTVKGVEWHLGNAYKKLEIRSREELIAMLAEDPDT